jgi:hypothetical protein
MTTPDEEYQAAVTRIREHLDNAYRPAFDEYRAALLAGDDGRMADVAERRSDAADEAESLWTATLHTKAMDLSPGMFVNEAAGAMAMLSDLWDDLTEVHRQRQAGSRA